jgi:tetratricopeptide (TPR) repeat protein
MNQDLGSVFQEALSRSIRSSDFEVTRVVAVPHQENRADRLRTLWEILKENEPMNSQGAVEYIVRVKPKLVAKSPAQSSSQVEAEHTRRSLGEIYLGNGKLNVPFLLKNADLLYDAGDYELARKVYFAILQSGEYTAIVLHRLGRCYEAEGKLEQARTQYEASIAYHPTIESYQCLAGIFIRQNKADEAAVVLARASALKEELRTSRDARPLQRPIIRALSSKIHLTARAHSYL